MTDAQFAATVSLIGVSIGALVSLIGTVVVPWIRDSLDLKRRQREQAQIERRDALMSAVAALLEMTSRNPGEPERNAAQARFSQSFYQLAVRVSSDEQDILDALTLMLVMVQRASGEGKIEQMIAETMTVLSLWLRGDLRTEDVIPEIESRANLEISADRKTATPKS